MENNKFNWHNPFLNAFGLFTIPSAIGEFLHEEDPKDTISHFALGILKLIPILGLITYSIQWGTGTYVIQSYNDTLDHSTTAQKTQEVQKNILPEKALNPEIEKQSLLEKEKLQVEQKQQLLAENLVRIEKKLQNAINPMQDKRITVNLIALENKSIKAALTPSSFHKALLDPTQAEYCKEIIKNHRKEVVEYLQGIVNLADDDFKVSSDFLIEVLFKNIKTLLGDDAFSALMCEAFPFYPMLLGVSDFVQYESQPDQIPFLKLAYFWQMNYLISHPKLWTENINEETNWRGGLMGVYWMSQCCNDPKSSAPERLKACLEQTRNLVSGSNAPHQFVKELFELPKEKHEQWQRAADKGLLIPFCSALLSYIDRYQGPLLKAPSLQEILEQFKTVIGQERLIALIKDSMPTKREWSEKPYTTYPYLTENSPYADTFFNFLMDNDPETWKSEQAKREGRSDDREMLILTRLERKNPEEYHKLLDHFLQQAKEQKVELRPYTHKHLFAHALNRLRKKEDLQQKDVEDLLLVFTKKDFPETWINGAYPSYPFIPPLSQEDTSYKLLFAAFAAKDPKLSSHPTNAEDSIQSGYSLYAMRKAFYTLDQNGMQAMLQLLHENKEYEHILKALLSGRYYNDSSIFLKDDFSNSFSKKYSMLLDVLYQLPKSLLPLGQDSSEILTRLRETNDPALAEKLLTNYQDLFPMLLFKPLEDQPEGVLSQQEKILVLTNGEEDVFTHKNWNLIDLAIKASKIDATNFYKNALPSDATGLLALWKKKPALAQKILLQKNSSSHRSYFAEALFDLQERFSPLLQQIWADDKEFFKQMCLRDDNMQHSLIATDFTRRNDSGLMTLLKPEEIREIIESGRGRVDPSTLAQHLLLKASQPEISLSRYFACMPGGSLPLDRCDEKALSNVMRSTPSLSNIDEVREISLSGSKLEYDTLKRLFKTFKNLDTIAICTSELPNLKSAFEHLLVDLKNGEIRPFAIRFVDLPPVEKPNNPDELNHELYAPVFERVGIKDKKEAFEGHLALAFSGRLSITKENRKEVKRWLASTPFTPHKIDLDNYDKELDRCRMIVKNRNEYSKNLINFMGQEFKSFDLKELFNKMIEEGFLLTDAIKTFILEYYLYSVPLTQLSLTKDELQTIRAFADMIVDPELDRQVWHHAYLAKIDLNLN